MELHNAKRCLKTVDVFKILKDDDFQSKILYLNTLYQSNMKVEQKHLQIDKDSITVKHPFLEIYYRECFSKIKE